MLSISVALSLSIFHAFLCGGGEAVERLALFLVLAPDSGRIAALRQFAVSRQTAVLIIDHHARLIVVARTFRTGSIDISQTAAVDLALISLVVIGRTEKFVLDRIAQLLDGIDVALCDLQGHLDAACRGLGRACLELQTRDKVSEFFLPPLIGNIVDRQRYDLLSFAV